MEQLIAETEDIILRNLLYNESYTRSVIPFLKSEYFLTSVHKNIFREIVDYLDKYNTRPTKEALIIEVEKRDNITQDDFEDVVRLLTFFHETKEITNDQEWLLDTTEDFCKDKALHNALSEAINIKNSKDNKGGDISKLLSDALSISFDSHIGHDYLDDAEERWEYYNRTEERIPFDIDYFNKITKNGVPKKTLNVLMGGIGTLKTGCLCHLASHYLMLGKNVLYITMEMAEERISERIDANLLNVDLDDLENLPKKQFQKKIETIKNTTMGKLIVKEYPSGNAHSGHFRYLIKELRLKRQFKLDVLIIDYLNICSSSRFRSGSNINSYTFVKAIAEEVRGLGVEFNVPVWSATQINRTGSGSSDPSIEDTSESFGLPATADLFLVIISNDELSSLNQLMFKQLKNRYCDVNKYKRFVVGIDKPKMRLYDVEQKAQTGITDSGINNKQDKKRFSEFKI